MFFPAILPAAEQAKVVVVLPTNASSAERIAADELITHLHILYPETAFATGSSSADATIYMGTASDLPDRYASQVKGDLAVPDSFAIKVADQRTALIAGSDPRAVLYATYALLERLGFGFYLSYSTEPSPRSAPFSFSGWELRDAPASDERAILDWYNFLSGCSTWNLEDWQHWITQASRMRFNTIMVHAYGNNPVFNFSFNGQTMPTGYLTSTRSGRDNGTEHVLDVRKMIGADGLYKTPVFGADASQVPDSERVEAAVSLMQKVFKFAAARGLGVTFGIDVDTEVDNPQNIIHTLPASARFTAGGTQLANPDTPDGYAYYRAQIEHLMKLYPEITQVAVWFRGQTTGGFSSPWRAIKPTEFPDAWSKEYRAALEKKSAMRHDPEAPSMFAISKIVRAFRKALDETGHPRVTLSAGSWRFNYVPAADAFMPEGVMLIPLDYSYEFPSDPIQHLLEAVGKHRPVIPIVWAQHDDRKYAGRSYTPFVGFGSLLRWSNNSGFGVIHWMTRPFDLYFKNVSNQVWASSFNETLDTTASVMARNTFGADAQELGKRYLLDWIYDAPAFGEETSNNFFLHNTVDVNNEASGTTRRLALLAGMKPLARNQAERDWIGYYEDWERYAQGVFQAQSALQDSYKAQKTGDLEGARKAIEQADPVSAIEAYSRAIRHGQTSRGEMGLLVSLNLRWLPYFKAQRVALGLDPLQVAFAPTHHDPLAKGAGSYTFDFDKDDQPIEVVGTAELGTDVREFAAGSPCRSGIVVKSAVDLAIGNIAQTQLPNGTYSMKLIMPANTEVRVKSADNSQTATTASDLKVTTSDGKIHFTLAPVADATRVCGVIIKLQTAQ